MEECGELHDTAALSPGKGHRYSLYTRLGGPRGKFKCYFYHFRPYVIQFFIDGYPPMLNHINYNLLMD
jgi:hypothetical protein